MNENICTAYNDGHERDGMLIFDFRGCRKIIHGYTFNVNTKMIFNGRAYNRIFM
jgi:hypothetical protein